MKKMESHLTPWVTVEGATLVSKRFPEGIITVDATLTYIGGETFILYDVAHCEIHLYAEADESGRVLRLYWFQFEGYLPSVTSVGYDYSNDPERTVINGHEFYDSVRYFNVTISRDDWSDDSDTIHMLHLLEQRGYHLDGNVMSIRLVRLDEDKQKELMIVYMEDLDQHGLSLKDFEEVDGDLRWRETSEGLRTRALKDMKMDIK